MRFRGINKLDPSLPDFMGVFEMEQVQLQHLFSQEPASLVWSASADGRRTVGTSEGFVLDLWPDRAEAAAVFPPDDAALAARNGTLLQLLLVAMRPDWQ